MGNTKSRLRCICKSLLTTDFSVEFWQAPWLFILPFHCIRSITRPLVTPADNHCECTEIMTSTTTVFSGFYARSSFQTGQKEHVWASKFTLAEKKAVTFRTTHLPTCLLLHNCVSILCTANAGSLYLCWVHKGHLVRKNHNTLKQHTKSLTWF